MSPSPIPTSASSAIIITKKITATISIARAFHHPHSKKCFTRPSKMKNRTIHAIIPSKKKLNAALIDVPRTAIHIESTNFAFSALTNGLPASQRTGAVMMMFTTICIQKKPNIFVNNNRTQAKQTC